MPKSKRFKDSDLKIEVNQMIESNNFLMKKREQSPSDIEVSTEINKLGMLSLEDNQGNENQQASKLQTQADEQMKVEH